MGHAVLMVIWGERPRIDVWRYVDSCPDRDLSSEERSRLRENLLTACIHRCVPGIRKKGERPFAPTIDTCSPRKARWMAALRQISK